MNDIFRRILYPTAVFVLIATVWVLGYAKSKSDLAHGFYPQTNTNFAEPTAGNPDITVSAAS